MLDIKSNQTKHTPYFTETNTSNTSKNGSRKPVDIWQSNSPPFTVVAELESKMIGLFMLHYYFMVITLLM